MENVTLSNDIVAQGLSKSVHPSGEHGKGTLTTNAGSLDPAYDSRISVVKNHYAHDFARDPEIRAGQEVEVVNDWMGDHGLAHQVLAIGAGDGGTLATTVNAIGNVFTPGPSSRIDDLPIHLSPMGAGSAIHLQDNLLTNVAVDANGDQRQTALVSDNGGARHLVGAPTIGSGAVAILDSRDVAAHVAANAGARPFDPDVIDAGIVRSAVTGTIVDSVAQAGGHRDPRRRADGSTAGRQAFVFIGTAEFTGVGQVRYSVDGNGDTVVQATTDDVLGADLQIVLAGPRVPPNAGDFLL